MQRVPGPGGRAALAALGALFVSALPAGAELAPEAIGRVETLPAASHPHWVWASDALLERITLVDLETGDMLGVVDGGWGFTTGLFPRTRPELYVVETHYSRGTRGQRTDVLTVYDAVTLAPRDEVILPPRRAINPLGVGNVALTDDERFATVFNMNPATSVSLVDLERRAFAGEVATPGCSLVYPAGPRRFFMPCADGALLTVTLDEQGNVLRRERGEPFFDVEADPLTEKAVRHGDRWIFVSFEGWIHEVDVSGAAPEPAAPWSLFDAADREARWRIGGRQILAVHHATGRLYVLVHQGPPDTHKQGGSELWVYDLEARERVDRIALRTPGLTYLGVSLEFGQGWIWPFNRLYDWLVGLADLGTGSVAVTQDDAPLLVTGSEFSGSLAVHDARSGDFLRRVTTGNMTNLFLQVPWQPEGTAP